MWAAIGLYGGREDNRVFRSLPDGTLEHRRTKTLLPRDTILLGDDTVHAVANPSREWTGAIHVYGGDFFRSGKRMWSDPARPAAPFDFDLLRRVLNDAANDAKELESRAGW
jgi:predicted metal-dependent enzyme (double-stranded beta helix superfamily)